MYKVAFLKKHKFFMYKMQNKEPHPICSALDRM